MNCAIVIPCYDRADSLLNLLNSISKAQYNQVVDLVFSIDYSGNNTIGDIAENFIWKYGNKRIIRHTSNIGLKSNILYCGDLTSEYEAIILLEDDLIVSPAFFKYAIRAAEFYKNHDRIAGISLYSYDMCEIGHFRFYPFIDEFDTYFIQWPSSWGQLWIQSQWNGFKNWLNQDRPLETLNIPDEVKSWENSWKKYFIGYLVDTNKFFVYPYVSYTNEYGEGGTHHKSNNIFQNVNLYIGNQPHGVNFRKFENTNLFYDCFFQLTDREIKVDEKTYMVTFNLYGTKLNYNIKQNYVISPQSIITKNRIFSFSNRMLPYEQNILKEIKGSIFHLCKNFPNNRPLNPIVKVNLHMELTMKESLIYITKKIFIKLCKQLGI